MPVGESDKLLVMDKNILNFGYFRLAKNAMQYSDFDKRYKMGAVIVKRKPIAVGFNKQKTHPKYSNLFSIHAELAAILSARTDIEGSDIYVYRETSNGIGLARPCNTCMGACVEAGIRRIFYSTKTFPNWEVIEL